MNDRDDQMPDAVDQGSSQREAVEVLPMLDEHSQAVLSIYHAGVEGGNATFETTVPTWQSWTSSHLVDHRFIAATKRRAVAGFAAVSPVSTRRVYEGVVEATLYIAPDCQGTGIGSLLLAALIESTERAGIWTIQSGVFPENTASLRLNEKFGFRVVGTRERIAKHGDRWRDVVLLERRSSTVV